MEDFSKLSVEEIEKMTRNINNEVKELEVRLKKKPIFNSPIDKFTKIDDLLRQNIHLQKELIEQIYISNQLSWATLKKSSDGFISPYPNGDRPIILGGDDDYKTIVNNLTSMKISGSSEVFKIDGSGIVGEIMFKSSNATVNNKVYGVRIMSDNSIAYQDTWANFFNRSFHEVDVSCWEDLVRNYYLLVIQKIAFAKNLIIEVYGSTTHFTDIYIKYYLKIKV